MAWILIQTLTRSGREVFLNKPHDLSGFMWFTNQEVTHTVRILVAGYFKTLILAFLTEDPLYRFEVHIYLVMDKVVERQIEEVNGRIGRKEQADTTVVGFIEGAQRVRLQHHILRHKLHAHQRDELRNLTIN